MSNQLRQRRAAVGWTQAALAQKAGISRAAVSAIEVDRLVPSVAAALALAQVLECSVEDLFVPEPAADREPHWAWPPAAPPCRFWRAVVHGQTLHYPSEVSPQGLTSHDGVWTGQEFRLDPQADDPARTLILASCDPAVHVLAEELARTAGIRLIVLARSSAQALELFGQGKIHAAGVHLTSAGTQGNAPAVRSMLGPGYCLLRAAQWQEGAVVDPAQGVKSLRSLVRSRLRWVGREKGSGARQCLDMVLEGRPAPRRLAGHHRGVADCVRWGWADAGVCLRLPAVEAGLQFFTVREEAYDLCFAAADRHDPRLQALVHTVRSLRYRRVLADLPGYDTAAAGLLEEIS